MAQQLFAVSWLSCCGPEDKTSGINVSRLRGAIGPVSADSLSRGLSLVDPVLLYQATEGATVFAGLLSGVGYVSVVSAE